MQVVFGKQRGGDVGFLAMQLKADSPSFDERTHETLGWQPTQPGLFANVEANRC